MHGDKNKMFKKTITLFMFVNSFTCYSTEYIGTIGGMNITASFTEDDPSLYLYQKVTASYMYNKYKTPIQLVKINDNSRDKLVYSERSNNTEAALFILNKSGKQLTGFWLNKKNGDTLPVALNAYDDVRGELQSQSLKEIYFRINCSKQGKIITMINKRTHKESTITNPNKECRHDELRVNDYNSDGHDDFLIYSGLHAYYRYNPKYNKYVYHLPPYEFQ